MLAKIYILNDQEIEFLNIKNDGIDKAIIYNIFDSKKLEEKELQNFINKLEIENKAYLIPSQYKGKIEYKNSKKNYIQHVSIWDVFNF